MPKHTTISTEKADVLLDTEAAAKRLSVSVDTLVGWRRRHYGPRFALLGRLVRYPASGIDEFVAQQTVHPEAFRARADRAADEYDGRTLTLPTLAAITPTSTPTGEGKGG